MFSKSSSSSRFFPNVSFEGYHRVGFIKSAHGLRGELHVGLFAGRADWESETLALLLPDSKELKIYEVQTLRPHKEGLLVTLKGVTDRNQSELLRKSQVYVTEDVLTAEEGEPIFLRQILGFEVLDKDGKALGKIESFGSNGAQDLLEVRTLKGLQSIPLVEDFLVDIDFEKGEVKMDLPPGLIEE